MSIKKKIFFALIIISWNLLILTYSISVIVDREICIPIFAVVVDSTPRGEVAKLCLKIVKGSGNVYISTIPLSGEGTQAYASIAVETACKLAINVNCNKYDFLFRIEAKSPSVEGPSASFPMSILTFSLLEDLNITNFGATGLITHSTFVANVGGVFYKIQAALNKNITPFYIPVGNRYDYVTEVKVKEIPYGIIKSEKSELVDLVEYYKERGIEVIPVIDLIEAIEKIFSIDYFSSIKINKTRGNFNELYKELMSISYKYLKSKLNGSDAKKVVECSKNYDVYTCASLAFILRNQEIRNNLEKKIKSLENPYVFLAKLKRDLSKNITLWWIKLENEKSTKFNQVSFELYNIIVDRLYDAEKNLNNININGNLKETIEKFAYIISRLESVEGWYLVFNKSKELEDIPSININKNIIEGEIQKIMNIIETELVYLSKLGLSTQLFEKDLNQAKEMLYEGYYLTSYFILKNLESRISFALIKISIANLNDETKKEIVKRYIEDINKLVNLYTKLNLPFLSKCYINYAKYWLDKGDLDKAIYYATYSSTLLYSIDKFLNNRDINISFKPSKIKIAETEKEKIKTNIYFYGIFGLLAVLLILLIITI